MRAPMDTKAEHSGYVRRIGRMRIRDEVVERHKKKVGECGSKSRPVYGATGSSSVPSSATATSGGGTGRGGLVHVLALGTEYLGCVNANLVA